MNNNKDDTKKPIIFRKRRKKKLKSSTSISADNQIHNESNDNEKRNPSKEETKEEILPSVISKENKEDQELEESDLNFFNKLKEVKLMQKYRTHENGIIFEEDDSFTESGLQNPNIFHNDPTKDFGDSFASETAQEDILKSQKEKWIEKEMNQKLLEQGRVLPQSNTPNLSSNSSMPEMRTLEQELYSLPAEFVKAKKFVKNEALQGGILVDNEKGERWLQGMTEVELPIAYKLNNIQETELAKKRLLEPKERRDRLLDIPRNFNQDFTSHHFDRLKSTEHKRKLQEKQQKLQMDRDRKRRRMMGPQFFWQQTPH